MLPSLFDPIAQFLYGIRIELTSQARNFAFSPGLWTVTAGARGYIGFGDTFLVDFLPRIHEILWAVSRRFGIKAAEMRGQCDSHYRAHTVYLGHIHRYIAIAPGLGKIQQLIGDICSFLCRNAWDRQHSAITLTRQTVAVLAICHFGLKAFRGGGHVLAGGKTCRREQNGQDRRWHRRSCADVIHELAFALALVDDFRGVGIIPDPVRSQLLDPVRSRIPNVRLSGSRSTP